ncbi:MAG TPA: 3-keto-5-aminohexanoate cleavage protein [Rhizomicrobium sp.]|nr:3-keto-5-aminohexanoate cleavage protein [Rhizomicrobium sp.]
MARIAAGHTTGNPPANRGSPARRNISPLAAPRPRENRNVRPAEIAVKRKVMNTPRTLRQMAARKKELRVKPELEAFQMGDVLLANEMVVEGLVESPPLYQFVLGGVGLEDNLYLGRGYSLPMAS